MDLREPIEIFCVHRSHKAIAIKAILEAHGVSCLLDGHGPVRVYIEAADVERAIPVIGGDEMSKLL